MDSEKISTKEKILSSAVSLFAAKGFTETTIRELATDVGVNPASIYYHFPSKNAILELVLNDYAREISNTFYQERLIELKDNPTADGILSCLLLVFPEDKVDYYTKVLRVMLQEQYRNPFVRSVLIESSIAGGERVVKAIIEKLIEYDVLSENTDPYYWAKAHSSLIYTFSSRMALGIGDSSPEFTGMGMVDMLRYLYDLLLKTCKKSSYTRERKD